MQEARLQLQKIIHSIELEEAEQQNRFRLDQQHTLRALKAEGLALHPLIITRKSFGYAEYPEISFKLNFPPEINLFKDGAAIECFCEGEIPVKGMLLNMDGKQGEFRIYAPDFPDWIENNGVGIKLAPDQRTTAIMKTVLRDLEKNKSLFDLFRQLHEPLSSAPLSVPDNHQPPVSWFNEKLNQSQQQAVTAILHNEKLMVVHGPPGTGKTTTLIEAIRQLVSTQKKILVTAPSNTAVDNLARGLLQHNISILRVGNSGKVDEAVFAHTPEGKLASSRQQKEIKALRIKADQFRKMALKYKRNFGKAEREQRQLLFAEVKNIRNEIKQLQAYNEAQMYASAAVILGTPIGLYDAGIGRLQFDTLVMDEAGQCIEPLAWCVFSFADKIVLAGDHFQLPPTVLSQEAAREGLTTSILERAITALPAVYLLNTQYRMRPVLAGFSGQYFYNGLLLTASHLVNEGVHLTFIDTAGSGYQEVQGSNGVSLRNDGELEIVKHLLNDEMPDLPNLAFLSPYAGQVAAARELLPSALRISTIDSFQGQEKDIILLSLVRSNDEGEIGFLKDYRRMNVAVTRARHHLYILGDSATIGADPFYNAFLQYIEEHGSYRSVWEFSL